MAHRGPGMRTPRTRAIDVGTASAGFDGAVPYDNMAGIPRSVPSAGQTYDDVARAARPRTGSEAKKTAPFKGGK